MKREDAKIGMEVMFGREGGEKTRGKLLKMNRAKFKIEQLESRGTFQDYPVGTLWTVPPHLVSPVNEVQKSPKAEKARVRTVDIADTAPAKPKPTKTTASPAPKAPEPQAPPVLVDVKTGKRFEGQPGETVEILFERLRTAAPVPQTPLPEPKRRPVRRDHNIQ